MHSFADLAKEHEEVLGQLKQANSEKEELVKENQQLKKSNTKDKVVLQKVASAGFHPITVASIVKKLETAGFVKEGASKSVTEEILKNPDTLMELVDAVASSFIQDDFSEGELSKSGSQNNSHSVVGKGKTPVLDKDGWSALIG